VSTACDKSNLSGQQPIFPDSPANTAWYLRDILSRLRRSNKIQIHFVLRQVKQTALRAAQTDSRAPTSYANARDSGMQTSAEVCANANRSCNALLVSSAGLRVATDEGAWFCFSFCAFFFRSCNVLPCFALVAHFRTLQLL
jgi:hypothetical protein